MLRTLVASISGFLALSPMPALAEASIRAVAIDPEYIQRSLDAGRTWFRVPGFAAVFSIAIGPLRKASI